MTFMTKLAVSSIMTSSESDCGSNGARFSSSSAAVTVPALYSLVEVVIEWHYRSQFCFSKTQFGSATFCGFKGQASFARQLRVPGLGARRRSRIQLQTWARGRGVEDEAFEAISIGSTALSSLAPSAIRSVRAYQLAKMPSSSWECRVTYTNIA